ncbi:MAG: tetratricopeptide repeat protein [Pyrinomonadaceae bacterium]|nr:tetratricopeptide repeat protein [Pyrinomonadaceae bacterium]
MSFDKNKAMRNAERFLTQGKIRGAINEYQRVVENDPKDFSTLNILGDLHAKDRDKQQAIGCFTLVAEHYNTQGFSHKAIAVYNKISRIEPGSIEVSAKLAELYQSKGSISEARRHYTTLAEHYQQRGQKIEALAIWKQIAELDPNNTETYLKVADTCQQEEQYEEAVRAFTEAGLRFVKQDKFEQALAAFSKALEIDKNNLRALKGLVKSQIGLGCADEAANTLEKVLQEQPHNRDVLYLLVDCYLDMNHAPQAERAVIKLVEQEPANYLKFLDLVKLYLKGGNLEAATRILSMSSEHLLVGGQAEEFLEWTNEVLARNPEQLDALRLLVRYYTWQRDETGLKQSLQRLAETARLNESVEDEHYALSQLIMIAPNDAENARRLQELGIAHGFETHFSVEDTVPAAVSEIPQFQNFAESDDESSEQNANLNEFNFAEVKSSPEFETNGYSQNDSAASKDFEFFSGEVEHVYHASDFESLADTPNSVAGKLNLNDGLRLQKEIESIEFYIEQGYCDLAAKSLDELEADFGSHEAISNLRAQLVEFSPETSKAAVVAAPQRAAVVENSHSFAAENFVETIAQKESITPKSITSNNFDILDELQSELDAEVTDTFDKDDAYETHYQMATAYKEMGLTENAIREFQDAINLVEVNDGTRRFFQCANQLGHCFMEKQMPKAAVKWFMRDLEVADLTDEEKNAVYYDIGDAFESVGEREQAVTYFEQLYGENVDYRDVSRRLQNLQAQ